jgi:hypothetical protein
MRKLLLAVLAIAVSPPLFAQNSGNITSNQSVCIGVSAEHSTVAVQVTGTWTGTLQPQVAVQGQAATNSQVVPSTSTTPASTITGNGVYYANVGGLSQFCILGNTVASGTAVIYLNVSKGVNASTLGGGGGGSGTVTNTGGNLTLNSVVLGAGTNDTKVSTGITTNGASELDLGVAGTNGALGLNGLTSGKATLTAPAIAGTVTNPVTISNVFAGPDGTSAAATYGFTSCASCGVRVTSGFTVLNGSTSATLQAAGVTILDAQSTGLLTAGKLLWGKAAPTIAGAGCGGSAASIADSNGSASFAINVGTAPTSAGCSVTLPTASTAWNCWANDITTNSTSVFLVKQTARSTTGATLVNFSDVAVATAPTANDIWTVHCFAD